MAAASCESKRSSAYSDDLQWRIVWQREALQFTISQIAVNLCVSESTVRRTIQRFETSGEVAKSEYPSEACSRKITEPVQFYIMNLVLVWFPDPSTHKIRACACEKEGSGTELYGTRLECEKRC